MKKIHVMIAGLPGTMATLVAQAIDQQEDMRLCQWALAENEGVLPWPNSTGQIMLVPPSRHGGFLSKYIDSEGIDVVVDFTQPDAANRNAEMYCEANIPFVMGTTGGNRQELIQTVQRSNTWAVIATNMAGPIVAFQEMIRFVADQFPGLFEGYSLTIRESHQAGKKDASGVAVGLLEHFAELGMSLSEEDIVSYRDPGLQQMHLHVPQEYLDGHGYHAYRIEAPDDSITLEFKHDVRGRGVYVDGAIKAIRFLSDHPWRGHVYSMVDVLREQ